MFKPNYKFLLFISKALLNFFKSLESLGSYYLLMKETFSSLLSQCVFFHNNVFHKESRHYSNNVIENIDNK